MASSLEDVRWLQTWSEGATTFRIGRARQEFVAEWVGVALLRADRAAQSVEFSVATGCDPEWAKKLENGQASALVRHLTGGMTLHASAVIMGGGGVLFLGESGSGKSTLAADLCLNGDCALLGDDAVALTLGARSVEIHATEAVHWLTPESWAAMGQPQSLSRKQPLRPRMVAAEGSSLRVIVKLAFDEVSTECRVARVTGRAAFDALSRSLFRFVLDEPATAVEDFERLARLAALVPMYELRRPRGFGLLGESRRAVAQLCGASGRQGNIAV